MRYRLLSGISPGFPELSQSQGQVTHVLLTRSPLIPTPKSGSPLDLHVLSTPPAFILSQDQTLHQGHTRHPHPEAQGSGGVQTELQHLTCRSSTTHRSTTRRPDPGGRPGAKSNPRAVQGSSIIRTMPFHQTRQTPAPQPKPRNHAPTRMTGLIGTGFSHTVEFSRSVKGSACRRVVQVYPAFAATRADASTHIGKSPQHAIPCSFRDPRVRIRTSPDPVDSPRPIPRAVGSWRPSGTWTRPTQMRQHP